MLSSSIMYRLCFACIEYTDCIEYASNIIFTLLLHLLMFKLLSMLFHNFTIVCRLTYLVSFSNITLRVYLLNMVFAVAHLKKTLLVKSQLT